MSEPSSPSASVSHASYVTAVTAGQFAKEWKQKSRRKNSQTKDNGDNHVTHDANHDIEDHMKLEDEIVNENLMKLQKIFSDADEDGGGGLDIDEFRNALKETTMADVDDHDLEIVFMKVDTNCDGTVDWDEYLSYMLLEYKEKDSMNALMQEKPFPEELQEIHSSHRDLISSIDFLPHLTNRHGNRADKIDHRHGRYVTASKDGIVNFWTVDMNHIKSYALESVWSKTVSIWVTDMVCLPNVNTLAVSTTERQIIFYDISGPSLDRHAMITYLENVPVCMNYWFDTMNMNSGILIWGDSGGAVSIIEFSHLVSKGMFGKGHVKKSMCRRFPFPAILKKKYPNVVAYKLKNLHEDWVAQVKYIPNLEFFISCCQSNNTSMYMGDFAQTKITSYFKVRKGILCFDYCPNLNIIVTGGLDHMVRVWNPYVTAKAIVVLKGHAKAVSHVVINQEKEQVISIAQDKTIRVYDLKDQSCVQSIPSRNVPMGPKPITCIYANPKTHCMILASTQLAMFEQHEEEVPTQEISSHNDTICAALYNKLFNQVVSACHESVVSVWDLDTGVKEIQFINAHHYIKDGLPVAIEITAMTFDPTLRRLITGARDGSVKIWNFNNGACLRVLETFDTCEVSGIVCNKQRIITAGWNRRVTIYLDVKEEDDLSIKQWQIKHNNDILSVDYYDPSVIGTSSYDGDILVWSLETGHVYCRLNVNEGVLPRTGRMHGQEITKTPVSNTLHAAAHSTVNVTDWMTFNVRRKSIPQPHDVVLTASNVHLHHDDHIAKDFTPRKKVCQICDGEISSDKAATPEIAETFCVCKQKEATPSVILPTADNLLTLTPPAIPAIQITEDDDEEEEHENVLDVQENTIPQPAVTVTFSDEPVQIPAASEPIKPDSPKDLLGADNASVSPSGGLMTSESTYLLRQCAPETHPLTRAPSVGHGLYDEYRRKHESSVDKIVFLRNREHDKETATLMACGAEGWVRAWSIHHQGGLLGQFKAAHNPDQSVLTMTTDSENIYLITGDTQGFIKVWDISNYCIKESEKTKSKEFLQAIVKRRTKFPYLREEKLAAFAKPPKKVAEKVHIAPPASSKPSQTLKRPILMNSFRGHMRSITHLEYIESKELLITSSSDCTLRLWTLCGRFIGTFGQKEPWNKLTYPIVPKRLPQNLPKDVKRVASATTLKVLNGGSRPRWRLARNIIFLLITKAMRQHMICDTKNKQAAQMSADMLLAQDTSELTKESKILGKTYKPKMRHKMQPPIKNIRHCRNQIAVYSALNYSELAPIQKFDPPPTVLEIQERNRQMREEEARKPVTIFQPRANTVVHAQRGVKAFLSNKQRRQSMRTQSDKNADNSKDNSKTVVKKKSSVSSCKGSESASSIKSSGKITEQEEQVKEQTNTCKRVKLPPLNEATIMEQ